MSVISYLISSAPFIIFSIFAIWISKQRYNTQPKLSALCIGIFGAMLLARFMDALLINELMEAQEYGDELYSWAFFYQKIAPFITIALDGCLLVCVFLWRKQSGSHYKKPALIALAIIGAIFSVEALSFTIHTSIAYDGFSYEEILEFQHIISFVFSCLFALIHLFSLFAIYGWRGDNFNNELLYMLTLKADPNAKDDHILPGLFQTTDCVPFLVGLFTLGGLLAVPLIWGGVMDMDYHEAVIPALISCALFAYCHNRKGRFLWDRLFIVIAFIAYVMFKITYLKGGSNEPFFIAGGILGYPVMFGAGWIGIMLVRLAKQAVMSFLDKKA